jgi:signal transduction histidine kinase/DNA-binding response OmpR family regulator
MPVFPMPAGSLSNVSRKIFTAMTVTNYADRLFRASPNAYLIMTPDFTIVEMNEAFMRATSRDEKKIGYNLFDAFPLASESDRKGHQLLSASLKRVLESRAPDQLTFLPYEIECETPEGREYELRFWNITNAPLFDDAGEVEFIFQHVVDVTEQHIQASAARQAQDEVKRYQSELERMVRDRTLELEETQTALQHSQKLESIGKLTGGVAHDFNNVLQIIGGNLQLLNAYIGNNELAAKRLEAAVAAVGRGAKLSSQLLAFARRQPLQPVVINLARIVRGTDDLLRQALGEAIRIETVVAGGLWNTLLDPHHLENVILNLAINASDAMQARGKLTIEVGNSMLDDDYVMSEPDVEPGQYVMLAISDTGSGMTPEIMQRAVEPFFTTKPEGEGTGLGLSMVYGFVKQSGGHFRMYSEVGYGTTVRMYFPRSYERETEAIGDFSGPVTGGSETILVVEDDIAVQTTVVEMLTDLGYSVLKADDAESALNILKSGIVIDLLFTDVVMPGQLRSPELARQAKLIIPGIEVLFTSGYTQNAIVHGGRLDPGISLLSKPYRREQLARKVRHLLSNRQQVAVSAKAIVTLAQDNTVLPKSSKLRILVVEDNIDSQHMACEILAILGHKAQGVATAEEAFRLLANDRFDILFTDIGLPDMNGVELAEKASADRPGLKIIFASGYHDAIKKSPHFEPVILPKPYDMAQLIDALEKTLR